MERKDKLKRYSTIVGALIFATISYLGLIKYGDTIKGVLSNFKSIITNFFSNLDWILVINNLIMVFFIIAMIYIYSEYNSKHTYKYSFIVGFIVAIYNLVLGFTFNETIKLNILVCHVLVVLGLFMMFLSLIRFYIFKNEYKANLEENKKELSILGILITILMPIVIFGTINIIRFVVLFIADIFMGIESNLWLYGFNPIVIILLFIICVAISNLEEVRQKEQLEK